MLNFPSSDSFTALEIAKMGVPALLSFFFGRFQALHGSKAALKKETRLELVKLTRKLAKDAIEYHSGLITVDERQKSSALIKNLLFQIRTDIKKFAELSKTEKEVWMDEYMRIQDAITEYPFEPQEMPEYADPQREGKISLACESLVRTVNKS